MAGNLSPVSVIIPAFNEEAAVYTGVTAIKEVLRKEKINNEIIVVDDGSKDNTAAEAGKAGAKVIRHMKNRGYGASLKTGIRCANNDILVIVDADGTYPAKAVPELLRKLRTADMVVGARVGREVNIPLLRRPAKFILKCLAGYITGERILDLNSGLRVFRRQCIEQYFSILSDRFSFTTTSTVAFLCDGYKIAYEPIDYHKRRGKSKIVPGDFLGFLTLVLRLSMLFHPLKIFIPAALLSFCMGILKTAVDMVAVVKNTGYLSLRLFFTQEVISASALIFLIAGLQLLLVGMMADGVIRKFAQFHAGKYETAAAFYVDDSPGEHENKKVSGKKVM